MRHVLILTNLILATIVGFNAYEWLTEPSVEAEVATTATRERRASTPQPRPIAQTQQTWQPSWGFASSPMSAETQVATTVALNIFDPERTPKATVNNNIRTMAMPANRGDMTLAGTFTIGEIAGAIILQRGMQMMNMRQQPGRNNNNNRNNNNTPNAEELAAAQEQQMQEALENRAELSSLLQTLQTSPGITAQQTELLRQRLNRANEQIALLQNQNQQKATGRDGLSMNGITATANASNSNKQYFRVGETLPNGYTLAAVTRSTATLTRNQERIELTMQGTSANAANGSFGMVDALYEDEALVNDSYIAEVAERMDIDEDEVEPMDDSLLATIANPVSVVFKPLGFGDWKPTIATVTGLVAKEEVVATFGVLYNYDDRDGEEELEENGDQIWDRVAEDFDAFSGGHGRLAAYSFMIFNLLCAPCFAAIGAIKREMNSRKWTWFAIAYQCCFAYAMALIVWQLGRLFAGGASVLGLIVALILLAALCFQLFRPYKEANKLTVG